MSVGGGVLARWSPDGHSLYYRSPTHIMAARLSTQGQLDVAKRDTLFADIYSKEGEGTAVGYFPSPNAAPNRNTRFDPLPEEPLTESDWLPDFTTTSPKWIEPNVRPKSRFTR